MRALVQRVTRAAVMVDDHCVASIGRGLIAYLGFARDDDERQLERLLDRVFGLRVFDDAQGRMQHALADVHGELLLVPQFTLYADVWRGRRPSFSQAMPPSDAMMLWGAATMAAKSRADAQAIAFAHGRFGAHMLVDVVVDGPVTLWIDSRDAG